MDWDNIKKESNEVECEDVSWIYAAQDRDQLLCFVNIG
jgi:hypothetical protein